MALKKIPKRSVILFMVDAGDPSLKPLSDWKDLWRGRPLAERTTLPTRYGDPKLEFPPACFDRLFAS